MRKFAFVLPAIAATASCGGAENETDNGITTEVVEDGIEIGETVAQPLQAGLWELHETIGEVDQATMRDRQEDEIEEDGDRRGATRTVCLPADYVDRPHWQFFAGSDNACDYESFRMDGGRIEATLTCNATPGTITVSLDGEYSERRINAAMTTARTGTDSENITVSGRLEGEWRGECPADEAG